MLRLTPSIISNLWLPKMVHIYILQFYKIRAIEHSFDIGKEHLSPLWAFLSPFAQEVVGQETLLFCLKCLMASVCESHNHFQISQFIGFKSKRNLNLPICFSINIGKYVLGDLFQASEGLIWSDWWTYPGGKCDFISNHRAPTKFRYFCENVDNVLTFCT